VIKGFKRKCVTSESRKTMEKNTKINIIYIRTSTLEQNPELQLKACEGINKWGEYTLFTEQQSAWKDSDREHFNAIIKLIKQRKVGHLICWDLDRLYRNRLKLIAFFKLCKLYKCKIHSVRQEWLEQLNEMPSPWDEVLHDFLIQVMGWLAEEESDKKSKRIKSAVRIRSDGAYSYKGNKWGRKGLSTFKKNKICEMRRSGMSMRQIAKDLHIALGSVHKIVTEGNG